MISIFFFFPSIQFTVVSKFAVSFGHFADMIVPFWNGCISASHLQYEFTIAIYRSYLAKIIIAINHFGYLDVLLQLRNMRIRSADIYPFVECSFGSSQNDRAILKRMHWRFAFTVRITIANYTSCLGEIMISINHFSYLDVILQLGILKRMR